MNKKVIVLFVEGSTEIEFYKAVVKRAHNLMNNEFHCSIEYIDMKGIGNYKKDALRQFERIKKNYGNDKEFLLFLCIDSDVFEFSKKPPINKKEIHSDLKKAGAKSVIDIIAKQSIEEWFLMDFEGVLSYLKLPKNTKRPKGNAQDALKSLFKTARKVYVKGAETEGFIKKLDIGKIMSTCCKSLLPLCRAIGFDCLLVCNSKD